MNKNIAKINFIFIFFLTEIAVFETINCDYHF